jgi:hypothetical protein
LEYNFLKEKAYSCFATNIVGEYGFNLFGQRAKPNIQHGIYWRNFLSYGLHIIGRSDQEILLFSKKSKAKYPKRLRRVSFRDETQNRTLVFLTNNLIFSAETIAALYKARWEIELFFKWIKQNLRVKNFYGTSPKAVKTQIWIAMIVYLILAIIKKRYPLQNSLSHPLHFLEVNLLEKKPLISSFRPNPRNMYRRKGDEYKLLTSFDY